LISSVSHVQGVLSIISIFPQINIGVRATLRRHHYSTQSLQSLALECIIKLRLLIRQLHLIITTGLCLIHETVVIRNLPHTQWRLLVQ
jgi:hypothetical protein